MEKTKVLFVCLGNICRSPSAEGVFRNWLKKNKPNAPIELDSAGTAGYHIGEPADHRSRKHALARGIDIAPHRARQLEGSDFNEYDWIITMDDANYESVMHLKPNQSKAVVRKMADFYSVLSSQNTISQIPDPYYGGPEGFELVLDLLEGCCESLYDTISAKRV